MATKSVLVSGGSGYIAGYLIRQLMAEGWTVHTTVRSLAREGAVRRLLAVDDARLRFFAADLNADAGWAQAMTGCSHVAHVASPFPAAAVKDAQQLIVPARDGVLRALRAARAAGVQRFVMTSSVAAIGYGHGDDGSGGGTGRTFTEADWTVPDSSDALAYVQSKTLAERAARDWVAAEGQGLVFCSINPSLVLGPVWSADMSTSIELVRRLLSGALPGCPDLAFGIVDVRDVADLHVRALVAPGLDGERFIASGPSLKIIQIARILKQQLGAQARKVPTRGLPDWLLRLAAVFDPAVRQVTGELGKLRHYDARHARERLGWVPRPAEQSIVDAARSLLALGIVKL